MSTSLIMEGQHRRLTVSPGRGSIRAARGGAYQGLASLCLPRVPPPPPTGARYSRGLFKHPHSLTAFWGLPFEDVAVIGPRGGGKGKDWRWAAIFKEGGVAWRGSCTQSKAESGGTKGRPRLAPAQALVPGGRTGGQGPWVAVVKLNRVFVYTLA